MKYVECSGTPQEMGRQYGEAVRNEIQSSMELWQPWFRNHPITDRFISSAASVLEQYAPDLLPEIMGAAESAGVPFKFLLAINFMDTFSNDMERCTPLLLHQSQDGPIVAKNNDAGPDEKFPFIIRKGTPDYGLPFFQVTYAGWFSGLDMMNSAGVANTHGSVGSIFPRTGRRLDIRLRLYDLMRKCRTVEQLTRGLQEVPLTGKGFSIAIGDAEGNTAFLDAAVPQVIVRDRDKPFEWSTNLYKAAGYENADQRTPAAKPFCLARSQYIASQPKPVEVEDVKSLLRNHSFPEAPCRHGGASLSVTVWSMICLPEKRKLLLASGFPCCNPYKEYVL